MKLKAEIQCGQSAGGMKVRLQEDGLLIGILAVRWDQWLALERAFKESPEIDFKTEEVGDGAAAGDASEGEG